MNAQDGRKYYDQTYKSEERPGLTKGNIIEVVVNLAVKSIVWNVNGWYHSSIVGNCKLDDPTRMFVPFVEMYTYGDCVEWLGSEQ